MIMPWAAISFYTDWYQPSQSNDQNHLQVGRPSLPERCPPGYRLTRLRVPDDNAAVGLSMSGGSRADPDVLPATVPVRRASLWASSTRPRAGGDADRPGDETRAVTSANSMGSIQRPGLESATLVRFPRLVASSTQIWVYCGNSTQRPRRRQHTGETWKASPCAPIRPSGTTRQRWTQQGATSRPTEHTRGPGTAAGRHESRYQRANGATPRPPLLRRPPEPASQHRQQRERPALLPMSTQVGRGWWRVASATGSQARPVIGCGRGGSRI